MRRRVSVAEAKDQLTGILRDVERGKSIEVTRRGEGIAVIVSLAEYERFQQSPVSFAEALRKWRKTVSSDSGFTDAEVASLRDRDPGRVMRFPK